MVSYPLSYLQEIETSSKMNWPQSEFAAPPMMGLQTQNLPYPANDLDVTTLALTAMPATHDNCETHGRRHTHPRECGNLVPMEQVPGTSLEREGVILWLPAHSPPPLVTGGETPDHPPHSRGADRKPQRDGIVVR